MTNETKTFTSFTSQQDHIENYGESSGLDEKEIEEETEKIVMNSFNISWVNQMKDVMM